MTATGATPRRGRVAIRLDGPVWPPRRRGVPEAGWDDDGFETVVQPGEQLALGFASPAEPMDAPVELVADERAAVDADDADGKTRTEPVVDTDSPDAVVRALADPRPPRDIVPSVPSFSVAGREACAPNDGELTDDEPADETSSSVERSGGDLAGTGHGRRPTAVDEWLTGVERRTEQAETLGSATQLPAAARAVEDVGGLAGVESLGASLSADAESLRAFAERARSLADRCEASAEKIPLPALRRFS